MTPPSSMAEQRRPSTATAAGQQDNCTSSPLLRQRADRRRCDVVTVHRAMGHAKTTLTTYTHLWPTVPDAVPGGRRRARYLVLQDSSSSSSSGRPCWSRAEGR